MQKDNASYLKVIAMSSITDLMIGILFVFWQQESVFSVSLWTKLLFSVSSLFNIES